MWDRIESDWLYLLGLHSAQVAGLALVVWLIVRFVSSNRPHLAHALWAIVLIKALTPPVMACPTSPFSWLGARHVPVVAKQSTPQEKVDSVVISHERSPLLNRSPSQTISNPSDRLSLESGNPSISDVDVRTTENGEMLNWRTFALWTWLFGSGVGLCGLLIRYGQFVWWLSRAEEVTSPELAEYTAQLARRLGIKRRVRLRVLNSSVGPVVLGFVRPTIILPALLTQGKTGREMEPLLAHELIHLRRGDLGWALIQSFAKSLLWFHPLVRWSSRNLTLEAERSCDEETVGSLGCTPAAYARCLLRVLEQKHQLRVAPALPGVRPVDITSARLERVMRLGKGIHRKSPAWTWVVLLIGCAIALPGAALTWGQEKMETNSPSFVFELTVAELTPKQIEKMPIHWNTELPNLNELAQRETESHTHLVSTVIEREIPTLLGRVAPQDIDAFRQQLAAGTVTLAPKLITRLGSTAELLHGAEVPVQQNDQIKFRPFGTLAKMTPRQVDENGIHFDCELQFSHLDPDSQEGIPLIARTKIQAALTAKDNELIAIRTQRVNDQDDLVPIVILIQCRELADGNQLSRPAKSAPTESSPETGSELTLDTRMVTLNDDSYQALVPDLKAASIEWTLYSNRNPDTPFARVFYLADDLQFKKPEKKKPNNDESTTLKTTFDPTRIPTQYAVLDRRQRDAILASIQSHSILLVQAPTITLLDQQLGNIFVGAQRPFVVDAAMVSPPDVSPPTRQPVVKTVNDGTEIHYTPTLLANGKMRLKTEFVFSQIISVDSIDAPSDTSDEPMKVQRPILATQQVSSEHEFSCDQTLALLVPALNGSIELILIDCCSPSDRFNLKQKQTTIPQCFTTVDPQSNTTVFQVINAVFPGDSVRDLRVSVNQPENWQFATDIPQVEIDDPEVVRFEFQSPREARVTGLKTGKTRCRFPSPTGEPLSFEVEVLDSVDSQEIIPKLPVQISAEPGTPYEIVFVDQRLADIRVDRPATIDVERLGEQRIRASFRTPGTHTIQVRFDDNRRLDLQLQSPAQESGLCVRGGNDLPEKPEDWRTIAVGDQTIQYSKSVLETSDGERTLLQANSISISFGQSGKLMAQAGAGELRLYPHQNKFELALTNNASLTLPEECTLSADLIRFEESERGDRFELLGSAKLKCNEPAFRTGNCFDATADHIVADGTTLKLMENARVVHKLVNGKDVIYEGAEIKVVADKIEVTNR